MLHKTSTEEKRKALSNIMDSSLPDSMGKGMIDAVYEIAERLVEAKIRSLIKERTGEEAIPEGTTVTVKNPALAPAGTRTAKIGKCMRFEEDTFGQGWYTYEINGNIMYGFEIEVAGQRNP